MHWLLGLTVTSFTYLSRSDPRSNFLMYHASTFVLSLCCVYIDRKCLFIKCLSQRRQLVWPLKSGIDSAICKIKQRWKNVRGPALNCSCYFRTCYTICVWEACNWHPQHLEKFKWKSCGNRLLWCAPNPTVKPTFWRPSTHQQTVSCPKIRRSWVSSESVETKQ